MLQMVANPGDGSTLKIEYADGGENSLEPDARFETPVSQESVIADADPEHADDRGQNHANRESAPGKTPGDDSTECDHVNQTDTDTRRDVESADKARLLVQNHDTPSLSSKKVR